MSLNFLMVHPSSKMLERELKMIKENLEIARDSVFGIAFEDEICNLEQR